MKFKFISYYCLCVLLLFAACANDDETIDPAVADGMTCQIDGNQWKAILPSASIFNGTINITGVSADKKVFTITIGDTTEGTYFLNPTGTNVLAYAESLDGSAFAFASNQNNQNTNYGKVVISKIDSENQWMSGTFETEAHRQADGGVKIITEGVFNNITFFESLPTTTSSLSASIDENAWEAVSATAFAAFGNLSINGTDAIGAESIGFTLPEDIEAGTYELESPGFSDYGAQYNIDSETFLPALTGTLVISEHKITEKTIKGTFSFEAAELQGSLTASITDGAFEIVY